MRDIHCPKDIGFENTFSGEDCEREQYYNNCYHCWSTALAKGKAHGAMPIQDKGVLDQLAEKQNSLSAINKSME